MTLSINNNLWCAMYGHLYHPRLHSDKCVNCGEKKNGG